MAMYLRWVRRWRKHWDRHGIDEVPLLMLAAVTKFLSRVVGSQRRHPRNWANARKSIHAWACGLETVGVAVPQWRSALRPRHLPPVLSAYAEYRRTHHGVTAITIHRDIVIAATFFCVLYALEGVRSPPHGSRTSKVLSIAGSRGCRGSPSPIAAVRSAASCVSFKQPRVDRVPRVLVVVGIIWSRCCLVRGADAHSDRSALSLQIMIDSR